MGGMGIGALCFTTHVDEVGQHLRWHVLYCAFYRDLGLSHLLAETQVDYLEKAEGNYLFQPNTHPQLAIRIDHDIIHFDVPMSVAEVVLQAEPFHDFYYHHQDLPIGHVCKWDGSARLRW